MNAAQVTTLLIGYGWLGIKGAIAGGLVLWIGGAVYDTVVKMRAER